MASAASESPAFIPLDKAQQAVPPAGTDRHAQADFSRALGYRHQKDDDDNAACEQSLKLAPIEQ
jgi:hypothetical protein